MQGTPQGVVSGGFHSCLSMDLSAMVASGRDLHAQVFVWVGRDSDTTKHKAAQKKGQQLGQRDGRAANTPVSIVQPGQEPSLFTAAFPSWSAKKAAQVSLACMLNIVPKLPHRTASSL